MLSISSPPWGRSTQKQAGRECEKVEGVGEGNGAHMYISAGDTRSREKAQFKLVLKFKGLSNSILFGVNW